MPGQILYCPVCSTAFSSVVIPRIFPNCNHSVCEECLSKILESNGDRAACPVDLIQMDVSQNHIHNFPKNFSLLRKLERKVLSQQTESGDGTPFYVLRDEHEVGCSSEVQPKHLAIQQHVPQPTKLVPETEEIITTNKQNQKDPWCFQELRVTIKVTLVGTQTGGQELQVGIVLNDGVMDGAHTYSPMIPGPDLDQENEFLALVQLNQGKVIDQPEGYLRDSIIEFQHIPNDEVCLKRPEIPIQKQQVCLAHQKPLDVVCMRDKRLVCSVCALFGQHKGHEVKSLIDVQKDIKERQKLIVKLVEQKQAIQKQVSQTLTKDRFLEIIQNKKDEIANQIRNHIQKTVDRLLYEQVRYLEGLDKEGNDILALLVKDVQPINQILGKIKDCERTSLLALELLESDVGIESKIGCLNYDKKDDFVGEVMASIDRIKEMKSSLQIKNKSIIGKLSIRLREPDFKSMVVLYKKKTSLELAYEPILSKVVDNFKTECDAHNDQEQLLIDGYRQRVRTRGESVVTNDSRAFCQTNSLSSWPLQPSDLSRKLSPKNYGKSTRIQLASALSKSKSKSKFSVLSIRNVRSASHVSKRQKNQNSPLQRRKFTKFKLPQKIEKVFRNLCLDDLQILDLNFGELGNEAVLHILNHMQNKKVKVVKLVRNRLTDQVLNQIWKKLNNVQSLNLSQNMLTDKVVDSFMANHSQLSSLKSLTLSQNKINVRAVKNRIQDIRKWNVTLSL